MKISHLGNNIQTIRKFRGMKQQELADKIGINMQSLSKIERGLNYPAYETLEKIMEVLDVTPNELLSGEWKYINQSEKEICQFLRAEERLNAELKHGHYDNFFDSEEEWLDYELEKLREYIADYINGKSIVASDLYPIKEFIQHLKFQKLLDRYDDLYSMDMFGESIEGHKYKTPYQVVKMINPNSKEDMELLREVLRNNHFDDEANANPSYNILIMRFAEILLTYAEAKIELNELDATAVNAIDRVRARVGMPGILSVDPTRENDQLKMRQIVRRERKVELAKEALMLFDMRRWRTGDIQNAEPTYGYPKATGVDPATGKYPDGYEQATPDMVPSYGASGSDRDINDIASYAAFGDKLRSRDKGRSWNNRHYLWPIPQTERNKCPWLEQNKGYGE